MCIRDRTSIIVLPCGFFFFLFSLPNLSRCRLDVCHTSTHGVALVRIQDAGLKVWNVCTSRRFCNDSALLTISSYSSEIVVPCHVILGVKVLLVTCKGRLTTFYVESRHIAVIEMECCCFCTVLNWSQVN